MSQVPDHFYTTSAQEGESAKSAGDRSEGIAFYIYPNKVNDAVALHRHYNSEGDHFYTTDPGDVPDYNREGITGYIYPSAHSGTEALHRHYGSGDHFYTTDPGDVPDYNREGITGYVYSSAHSGTVPVFRWWKDLDALDSDTRVLQAYCCTLINDRAELTTKTFRSYSGAPIIGSRHTDRRGDFATITNVENGECAGGV